MRLRKSASSVSGAWKEKGRISSLLAICEPPWFDDWENASRADASSGASTLAMLVTAEAARKSRRVGGVDFVNMTTLLVAIADWLDRSAWPAFDGSSDRLFAH